MNYIQARCLMCGKIEDVGEDHQDYVKLVKQEKAPTFICDICRNRVRYESDEQRKPKKPM
ncbi:MAG: DUF2197 domain-containing protein [Syntrophomonadaceae bacterium]|nr:DUF2197 domain-containing protein [Syntrophomonadaceae bacterium]